MQIYTMSSFAVNKCFTLHQRVHAQTHVFKVSVCKGFQWVLFVATVVFKVWIHNLRNNISIAYLYQMLP
jgi:hypothetical protein